MQKNKLANKQTNRKQELAPHHMNMITGGGVETLYFDFDVVWTEEGGNQNLKGIKGKFKKRNKH